LVIGLPIIAVLVVAGLSYLHSRDQPLNTKVFVPFVVTAKEQISPSAFMLTVRPRQSIPSDIRVAGYRLIPDYGAYAAALLNNLTFQKAWATGATWSVEIKQPQLQVSRDYTPLPPVHGAPLETMGKHGLLEGLLMFILDPAGALNTPASVQQRNENYQVPQLRFLIRKVTGGEVSNYLSTLNVGDTVELRGPHHVFAIRKRLGDAERVVFLAGGTGIAPAMQVVKALVEDTAADPPGKLPRPPPKVDIIWANRSRDDCRGCERLASVTGLLSEHGAGGPILDQLADIQKRFPGRVTVRCTVDAEGSFIDRGTIARLVESAPPADGQRAMSGPETCALHSQKDVEQHPAMDPDVTCRCGSGKNLLFVSGPEGFVEAYAGPKIWDRGLELQGPVGGLLGELRARNPHFLRDWLVLKL
jgi:hypothetical protein